MKESAGVIKENVMGKHPNMLVGNIQVKQNGNMKGAAKWNDVETYGKLCMLSDILGFS